jgi:hypothetical protein
MSAPGNPSKPDFTTRAKANDVPVARLIGFEAKEIADGRALVTLASGPQHANPKGTLHGGILCDIADAAMGMAFASTLVSSFAGIKSAVCSSNEIQCSCSPGTCNSSRPVAGGRPTGK